MQSWFAPSSLGATESKIVLWAQAARLRKHLAEDTALCEELTLDLFRSRGKIARLKILHREQAKLRKQVEASRLEIKHTEILLELLARSV
jgi:hypothetical protein